MVAINEKLMPGAGPQNLPVGNYYLLQDTLYRAVALTDSGGNIVEAYGCDAYGNALIFTAADSSGNWWGGSATQSNFGANEIIFCGYRLDPEAENYYVRNRFYSPTLGRWLTRDPIGYAGGINLYEYVGGGAVSALDPDGQWHWYEPWTWPLFHSAPVKVPRVTGIPHVDAKTYLRSIKDHELGAAKDFIQEAAKKYAEDGDSNSLAKALRNLATGSGPLSNALDDAADSALGAGLDALSKDAGATLGSFVGALKTFSASSSCGDWYIATYRALEAATEGNTTGCNEIPADNPRSLGNRCMSAIESAGAGVAAVAFERFAQGLSKGCFKLGRRACKAKGR